jgi:hypothetical protein
MNIKKTSAAAILCILGSLAVSSSAFAATNVGSVVISGSNYVPAINQHNAFGPQSVGPVIASPVGPAGVAGPIGVPESNHVPAINQHNAFGPQSAGPQAIIYGHWDHVNYGPQSLGPIISSAPLTNIKH